MPTAEEPQAESAAPGAITRTPSAEGARVFFITPSDGDVVASPVQLEFGLGGMELAPSGDDRPNSGHHHIIIDRELPTLSLPVPADAQLVHFGDGRLRVGNSGWAEWSWHRPATTAQTVATTTSLSTANCQP